MNDGYALLRAIEANPEEDTPRLAYADWLDENAASESDRARAEFIRVQCELARGVLDEVRRAELTVRERNAVAPYCTGWVGRLPMRLSSLRFERGFLDCLHIDSVDWVRYAERLAALEPLLNLIFQVEEDSDDVIGTPPVLRFVRRLTLSSRNLSPACLAGLATSLYVDNLRCLNLGRINQAGCEALAAGSFPALRELLLSGNPIGNHGFAAIRYSPWFSQIESLGLTNCGLSDAAVVALLSDPRAAQFRSLSLGPFEGADEVAQTMLASPHLAQLEHLLLMTNDLSESMRAALRNHFQQRLRFLGDPFA